jgi:transcriptional regulator with XRE-family HTH domain
MNPMQKRRSEVRDNPMANWRRNVHGWRQKDLATISGIGPTYISQIERGWKIPTVDETEKLALAFNLPTASILFLVYAGINSDHGMQGFMRRYRS